MDTPLSEVGRLTGVFHSPGETFPDIAGRGRWWAPLLIMVLCTVVFTTLFVQRVGYDRMIQRAFDRSPQIQQMPAEQRANAFEMQRKMMPYFLHVAPVVGTIVIALVIAAALLFLMNGLFDAGLKFKAVLNMTSYAMMPAGITGTIITIVILHLKPPDDFDIENPLAFNAGAFLNPDTTAKWLQSLASSFDLFTFWTIALLAVAYSSVCGAKRMPFSRALTGILIPFAIWVVGKVGFAALFR